MSLRTYYNNHKELIWELAKREVSDRYARHAMGVAWAVCSPLLMMLVYIVIFTYIFPIRTGLATQGVGGHVGYLLSGLVSWMAASEHMMRSTGLLPQHRDLIKQIVFPLEVLPIKSGLASLLTLLILSTIVILYSLIFGSSFGLIILLYPIVMAVHLVAFIGLGYWISTLTAFSTDLREVVQFFTAIGLFLAPIFYSPEMMAGVNGKLALLINLNPFTHMVHMTRDVLSTGTIAQPLSWILWPIFSDLVLISGRWIFAKMSS